MTHLAPGFSVVNPSNFPLNPNTPRDAAPVWLRTLMRSGAGTKVARSHLGHDSRSRAGRIFSGPLVQIQRSCHPPPLPRILSSCRRDPNNMFMSTGSDVHCRFSLPVMHLRDLLWGWAGLPSEGWDALPWTCSVWRFWAGSRYRRRCSTAAKWLPRAEASVWGYPQVQSTLGLN